MADYKPCATARLFSAKSLTFPARAELPGLPRWSMPIPYAGLPEEAGKVSGGTIVPLNRSGDEEGCSGSTAVKTPAGFPEAYQTYAEGGWSALAARRSS